MKQHNIVDGGVQFVPQFTVQYVYLDFDGELTSYNGEILAVDNVEVENPSLTEECIANIVSELNAEYIAQNIIFLTERPEGTEYSTIFIGKTSAFDSYGNFSGIAETIDKGNKNKKDNAFVFMDNAYSTSDIINAISHEVNHIVLGAEHKGDGISAYALSSWVSRTTVSGTVISSGDEMIVCSSGITSNVTIRPHGYQYVSNGGRTFYTYCQGAVAVLSSGSYVLDGGQYVLNGGFASYTNIVSSAYQAVYGGGYAYCTNVGDYGNLFVYTNGSAYNPIISGYSANAYIYGNVSSLKAYSGQTHIYNSGVVRSGTVQNSATVNVYNGGFVRDLRITNGKLSLHGGIASNIVLSSGGVNLNSGASLTTAVISGNMQVSSGCSATEIFIYDSASFSCNNGILRNIYIWGGSASLTGGVASDISVGESGVLSLTAGGTINSSYIYSSGALTVSSGNVRSAIIEDGSLCAKQGTAISNSLILSGGIERVESGATDSVATIESNGNLLVSSGGKAISPTVSSAGSIYVYSGGVISSGTVNSGGNLWLGGSATGTNVSGGYFYIGYSTMGAGTANETNVCSGGGLALYNGSITNTTICDEDSFVMASGMTSMRNTVLQDGATAYFSDSVFVDSLLISQGCTVSVEEEANITLTGDIEINGTLLVDGNINAQNANISIDLTENAGIAGLSNVTAESITLKHVDSNPETYLLATDAAGFVGSFLLEGTGGEIIGNIDLQNNTLVANDRTFTLVTTSTGSVALDVESDVQIYTVTTNAACGEGSLYEAIYNANMTEGRARIEFDESLKGATINGALLDYIIDDVEIVGLGQDELFLDLFADFEYGDELLSGDGTWIAGLSNVSISGLTVKGQINANTYGFDVTLAAEDLYFEGYNSGIVVQAYDFNGEAISERNGSVYLKDVTCEKGEIKLTSIDKAQMTSCTVGYALDSGITITNANEVLISDTGVYYCSDVGLKLAAIDTAVVEESYFAYNKHGINAASIVALGVTDTTVAFNNANYRTTDLAPIDYGAGVGIFNCDASYLFNCTIMGNESNSLGGGVIIAGTESNEKTESSFCWIDNSSISYNSADFGGGVYTEGQVEVLLENSVISDNSAVLGGGLFQSAGTVMFDSTTELSGNMAVNGGAVYVNYNKQPVLINNAVLNDNRSISSNDSINTSGEQIPVDRFENRGDVVDLGLLFGDWAAVADLNLHNQADVDTFVFTIKEDNVISYKFEVTGIDTGAITITDPLGNQLAQDTIISTPGQYQLQFKNTTNNPIVDYQFAFVNSALFDEDIASEKGMTVDTYLTFVANDDYWDNYKFNASNNSITKSTEIVLYSDNTIIHNVAIGALGDEDFYELDLTDKTVDDCEVRLMFDRKLGDLDLCIYNEDMQEIAWCASENSSEVYYFSGLTPDKYYIQVKTSAPLSEKVSYTLSVNTTAETVLTDDVYENNNSLHDATNLGALSTVMLPIGNGEYGKIFDGLNLSRRSDVDFYTFTVTEQEISDVVIQVISDEQLFAEVYNAQGVLIDNNFEDILAVDLLSYTGECVYVLTLPEEMKGNFTLKVYGAETTEYSLFFLTEKSEQIISDAFETSSGNDSKSSATDLKTISGKKHWNGLTIDSASDKDYYKFKMAEGELGDIIKINCQEASLSVVLTSSSGKVVTGKQDEAGWLFDMAAATEGDYYLQITSTAPCGYDIDFDFKQNDNTFTITDRVMIECLRADDYRSAIENAVAWWESVILSDIENYTTADGTVIDDIVINFSYDGTLGAACGTEITGIRTSGESQYMPYEANIKIGDYAPQQYDVSDLTSIIKHEIAHALGFSYDSSLWLSMTSDGDGNCLTKENCLQNITGDVTDTRVTNPLFCGSNTMNYYSSIIGENDQLAYVPLQKSVTDNQETISAGSYAVHWDVDVFSGEMLIYNTAEQQCGISQLTLYALQDLGYDVNVNAFEAILQFAETNTEQVTVARENVAQSVARSVNYKVAADDFENRDFVVLRQSQLLEDISIHSDDSNVISRQDEYVFILSEQGKPNEFLGVFFENKITPEFLLYDQYGREVSPYVTIGTDIPNSYYIGLTGLAAGAYRFIVNGSPTHYDMMIHCSSLINESAIPIAPAETKITASPSLNGLKITVSGQIASRDTKFIEIYQKSGLCGEWTILSDEPVVVSDVRFSAVYDTTRENNRHSCNNMFKIVSINADGARSGSEEVIYTDGLSSKMQVTEMLTGNFSSKNQQELLIFDLDGDVTCQAWSRTGLVDYDTNIDQTNNRCEVLAAGDYNGDGFDDVLIRSGIRTQTAQNSDKWSYSYAYADLHNGLTNARVLFASAGDNSVSLLGRASKDIEFLASDDMNYDGKSDILWCDEKGNVYLMNQVQSVANESSSMEGYGDCIGTLDIEQGYSSDSFLATGNFNHGAQKGVLMASPEFGDPSLSCNIGFAVWMYDNSNTPSAGWLGAMVNTWEEYEPLKGTTSEEINALNYRYDFVGVGDFNGDGIDDVMIQNTMPEAVDGTLISGSGDIFVFITGNDTSGFQEIDVRYTGCVKDDWHIVGISDGDGDGDDDLWLCSNDGSLAVWNIQDGRYTGIIA